LFRQEGLYAVADNFVIVHDHDPQRHKGVGADLGLHDDLIIIGERDCRSGPQVPTWAGLFAAQSPRLLERELDRNGDPNGGPFVELAFDRDLPADGGTTNLQIAQAFAASRCRRVESAPIVVDFENSGVPVAA